MKKLQASSLIYTITIVFLTGIMASSFLLYQQLSQRETDLYLLQFRLNKNAHSGMEYLLAAGDYLEYDTPKQIFITEEPTDSVEINKKSWGIFDIGISRSHSKNKEVQLTCLIGSQLIGDEKNGLYVVDLDREISICGRSKLDGITYLPDEGIKRAYIEGENYIGEKLVYGTQRKSDREMPDLNRKILEQNLERIKGKTIFTDSLLDWDSRETETVLHSFHEKTIVFQQSGAIQLRSGYYSGNIIFISSSEILVDEHCKLENVLLFAPKITIENQDSSFFQAFASDTLIVKEKSVLLYPTVLGIINEKRNRSNEPLLQIEKEVLIGGSLLVYEMYSDHKNYPRLEIHENAKHYGEIYTNGKASLQGEIYGTAMVFKLYLKTKSSGYENHLLNSVIDGNMIPPAFCGMTLKDKRYSKKILQWL